MFLTSLFTTFKHLKWTRGTINLKTNLSKEFKIPKVLLTYFLCLLFVGNPISFTPMLHKFSTKHRRSLHKCISCVSKKWINLFCSSNIFQLQSVFSLAEHDSLKLYILQKITECGTDVSSSHVPVRRHYRDVGGRHRLQRAGWQTGGWFGPLRVSFCYCFISSRGCALILWRKNKNRWM